MTATTHTPGPWEICIGSGDSHRVGRWHSGPGAYECVADCSHAVTGSARGEANARLIAAAPDMLAALQAVAYWLPLIERTERNTLEPRAPACTADAIRAAIAKAAS